jgi:hypothetical protein
MLPLRAVANYLGHKTKTPLVLFANSRKCDVKESTWADPLAEMFKRAMEGFEPNLGKDYLWELSTIHSFANLDFELQDYVSARKRYEQALAGYEAAMGPDHRTTLSVVHNFGILEQRRGNLVAAEKLLLRAFAGREHIFGPLFVKTLEWEGALGALHWEQSKLDQAKTTLSLNLDKKININGWHHDFTKSTVAKLTGLCGNDFQLSSVENVKSASEALEVFKETNEQKAERRSEDDLEHERTDRRLEVEQIDTSNYDEGCGSQHPPQTKLCRNQYDTCCRVNSTRWHDYVCSSMVTRPALGLPSFVTEGRIFAKPGDCAGQIARRGYSGAHETPILGGQ